MLVSKKIELEEYIAQKGFWKRNSGLPILSSSYCMADNDSSILINPNGDIGKCEHHIFDSLIVNIDSNEFDKREISLWKKTVEFENCGSCPIYPTCFMLEKCESKNSCDELKNKQK